MLSERENGFKIAMKGLDGGRLNIAACSLGTAQSAFERAVEYVGDSLLARGHDMVTVAPCNELMGHAGAIIRDTKGAVEGASDPRSDGKAFTGHYSKHTNS